MKPVLGICETARKKGNNRRVKKEEKNVWQQRFVSVTT
jgi:hypothetical protein